ncbi:guanine nucleotide-binding protein alpha-4 subunit [Mycena filopes]|nr:guanine nucleotide-binding protein alpha-4 subunit [Mycena filopes]
MTVGPDIDPLTLALAPPPGETSAERETHLIDQELNRQRAADKKAVKPSGVSPAIPPYLSCSVLTYPARQINHPQEYIAFCFTSRRVQLTLLPTDFQLINNQKAFRAERPSWRAVVHLNVVRSVRLIVNAISEAEVAASSTVPPAPDDPVYPPITPELLTLKMRLLPLQQVEEALLGKLTPGAKITAAHDAQSQIRDVGEVYVNSTTPWKGAFSRLMNNVRSSVDGPEVTEPQDSRDARQLLHACSEDMIRLWNDPTVKLVLQAHRLRLEDMAGLCVDGRSSSDSIERVTALSYEPTDDDILKARLKTLGNMVPQSWVVYDVGGARVPFFDSVDALIFLAPLSCFDQVLAEDETVNRLEDSILLWKTIVASPLLKDYEFDFVLEQAKLASGQKFAEYVVSYGDRANDFDHASQLQMGMWLTGATAMIAKQYSPEPRSFYSYFTAVTDIQSTKDILGSVRDMLVRQNLTRSRLV